MADRLAKPRWLRSEKKAKARPKEIDSQAHHSPHPPLAPGARSNSTPDAHKTACKTIHKVPDMVFQFVVSCGPGYRDFSQRNDHASLTPKLAPDGQVRLQIALDSGEVAAKRWFSC
jgi:hypothetical protein